MFGKASETFAWKKPCKRKLLLLYHRSLNSNFAAEANDYFFPEYKKKKKLILTPSHLSGSGEKFSVCQGQRCLNGISSSPSRGKVARISLHFALFPGHPLSVPFSCPCSWLSLRVGALARVGQDDPSAECAFDFLGCGVLTGVLVSTHCPLSSWPSSSGSASKPNAKYF